MTPALTTSEGEFKNQQIIKENQVEIISICSCFSFDQIHDPEPSAELGICQPYTGKICEKYMRNQTVFISPETTMEMLEEKLARAYGVIRESKDMNSICANFAVPSLCITVRCETKKI